ncbi:MAG TPA: aminotransferase class V-fold PLP-dependent enzyme, partial [Puia sp.]|nr:aminotransferase class V-fold PLP-dependent enzyme [Puia sp.]
VLGTARAIEYCLAIGEERIEQRVKLLADRLRGQLAAINGVRVLDKGPKLGALVTFTVAGGHPQELVNSLLQRGINVVPSFREFAVIDFDEKKVEWAIRASPHYYNEEWEVDALVAALKELIPR